MLVDATDSELLGRFIDQGSQDAFTDLVHRHLPVVYASCRRRLGDPSAADDAAQAVFIILSRRAGSLRDEIGPGGRSLSPWLHSAAHHVCANASRERRRRAAREAEAAAPTATSPLADRWEDAQPLIDDALQSLPARYREPLVLRHLAGKDISDVASELGISYENAKKRLQRGSDLLRRRLSKGGVTVASTVIAAGLTADADAGVPSALASAIAAPPAASITHLADQGLAHMSTTSLLIPCAALACIAAVGIACVAAAEQVPEPVPKPAPAPFVAPSPFPTWRLATGQVLYFDAALDWTFQANVEPSVQAALGQVVPDRLVEVALYRGVVTSVVDGKASVDLHPLRDWKAWPGSASEMKGAAILGAHGAPMVIDYSGPVASASEGNGDPSIAIDADTVGVVRNSADNSNDMNPICDMIGVPGLIIPLGQPDQGPQLTMPFGAARGVAGRRGAAAEGSQRYALTWPKIAGTATDFLKTRMTLLGSDIDVALSFTADGAGKADLVWNAARGMASSVDSSWAFETTVTLAQIGGALSLSVPAHVEFSRSAHLLGVAEERDAASPSVASVLEMMKNAAGDRWFSIYSDATAKPALRAVAFAILKDLADTSLTARWQTTPVAGTKDF